MRMAYKSERNFRDKITLWAGTITPVEHWTGPVQDLGLKKIKTVNHMISIPHWHQKRRLITFLPCRMNWFFFFLHSHCLFEIVCSNFSNWSMLCNKSWFSAKIRSHAMNKPVINFFLQASFNLRKQKQWNFYSNLNNENDEKKRRKQAE